MIQLGICLFGDEEGEDEISAGKKSRDQQQGSWGGFQFGLGPIFFLRLFNYSRTQGIFNNLHITTWRENYRP